jgi:hypothetical protein
MRLSMSRGMAGGSMAWFAIAAALWSLVRARRGPAGGIERLRLRPGDHVTISVIDPYADRNAP